MKTIKRTVRDIVRQMRLMPVGEEIRMYNADYDEYSITRLPDTMIGDGKCWIAGGGAESQYTTAFSETQREFDEEQDILWDDVEEWIKKCELLETGSEYVNVKCQTGMAQQWKFAATNVEQKRNMLYAVEGDIRHMFRVYIAAPENASDDKILRLTREALLGLDYDEFKKYVDLVEQDPLIDEEELTDLYVQHGCDLEWTDLPSGALSN